MINQTGCLYRYYYYYGSNPERRDEAERDCLYSAMMII
jgi:hypothetical protein